MHHACPAYEAIAALGLELENTFPARLKKKGSSIVFLLFIKLASQLPSFLYTNQQIKLLDRRMFIILMMQVGEEWRAGRARPENEGDDRSLELIRISEEVSIIMATAETFKTLSSGSRKLPETSTR